MRSNQFLNKFGLFELTTLCGKLFHLTSAHSGKKSSSEDLKWHLCFAVLAAWPELLLNKWLNDVKLGQHQWRWRRLKYTYCCRKTRCSWCQLLIINVSRVRAKYTPCKYRPRKFGERAFAFAGAHYWHTLPATLQKQSNTAAFKRHLKTFVFEEAYL